MAQRGRPRGFDRTEALGRAMEVFWLRGYEAASMTELTGAMGISSPSLYAAFGSKEALFREAIAHYNAIEGATPQRALDDGPTARQAVETMLRHNAFEYARPARPWGCMVLAATAGMPENDELRHFLATCRADDIDSVRRRIQRGIDDGDVPPRTDSETLARFVNAVMQGMSTQARDGADQTTLDKVVDAAMSGWDRFVEEAAGHGRDATAGAAGRPAAG